MYPNLSRSSIVVTSHLIHLQRTLLRMEKQSAELRGADGSEFRIYDHFLIRFHIAFRLLHEHVSNFLFCFAGFSLIAFRQ